MKKKDTDSIFKDLKKLAEDINDTNELSLDQKNILLNKMNYEVNLLNEFGKRSILNKDKIGLLLNNTLKFKTSSFKSVINYEPGDYKKWDGTYKEIFYGKKNKLIQPQRDFSDFKLSINEGNSIGFSEKSIGIYLLKNNEVFYIGKTDKKINQRFNAHITKITGINNKRHHHPKKWREYAFDRYNNLLEGSLKIDDFEFTFFDLKYFENYIASSTDEKKLSEFESIVFFYFQNFFQDLKTLNTISQVGIKFFRDLHSALWKD